MSRDHIHNVNKSPVKNLKIKTWNKTSSKVERHKITSHGKVTAQYKINTQIKLQMSPMHFPCVWLWY